MNKPKPNTPSGTQHHNIGQSPASISNNAPKSSDKLKNTPSNYKNNNVSRKASNASSVGSASGRLGSANSQKGNSAGGNKQNSSVNNHNSKASPQMTNVSPTSQKPLQTTSASPPIQKTTHSTSTSPSAQKSSQPTNVSPPSQKSITFASRPTVSSTSVKSTNGNVSNAANARPKSSGTASGNNNTNTSVPVPTNTNTTISSNNNNNNSNNGSNNNANNNPNKSAPNTSSRVDNNSYKPSTSIVIPPPPKPKTMPSPVSQSRYPNNTSRSLVSLERSRNFRAFIEKAMTDRKIFSCVGVYPAIRNALKKRGWVEKPGPLAYSSRSANGTLPQSKGGEDESDVAWMSRILKDYVPDFIWVIRRDNIDWKSMSKEQLINRFPKAWFTTKVGLAACLQHMHWFSEAGVSDTFFPRCYRLCLEEERQAFQDDFRLTACMSYLRFFVDTYEKKGHGFLCDAHSKITPLSVDFASRQLGNYVRMRRHEDIDWLLPPNFMTQHWDAFIHQYYAVVHEKKRLRFDSPEAVAVKYETAKKTLQKVAPFWPQIQLDGMYNMWICKPGARSRGKGIVIMNNLDKIMDLMTQSNFRECNWVVQKYIEKPMLIYKTKFDIRQWFIITDWTPLTVWFYKESYARFCTKPFVLENFHESIHLCNNAIQCRYQNAEQRDPNLPEENMWSSDTFQTYLKTLGKMDAWPVIYSKMKQAIVGVLLASQENVENKRGCYELYGADFMLTDDLQPWLIEINSCPCMSASTSVTARMCAQCLEDTIKVVIDRKLNKNAETGMFEMIYRQNAGSVTVQQFSGHDLTIIGKKLTRDIDWPMTLSKAASSVASKQNKSQPAISQSSSVSQSNNATTNNNNTNPAQPQSPQSNGASISTPIVNKPTLSELLQKLRVRNQEMFQGALAAQQARMDHNLYEAKTPRIVPTNSGGSATNSEHNAGTSRKHNRTTDANSMYEMMYKQSAVTTGLQHFSGHDLTVVGKKLTGDVDWPINMSKSMGNADSRHPKYQPIIPQQSQSPSRNNNEDGRSYDLSPANKPTLSELLQKLRVRNQDVFEGGMDLV